MTKEEHDMLVENNYLLRQILLYLISQRDDGKDFLMNIVANIIANKIN